MTPAKAFRKIAHLTTDAAGSPFAVGLAFGAVVAWAVGGWLRFGFGDHYQMYINTGTTIVTFLMGFLIQATTNREARATHAKLDELIRANRDAKNKLIGLEEKDDEVIDTVRHEVRREGQG